MHKFRVELQEGGIGRLYDLGADMTLQRMVQGCMGGGGGVLQGLVGLWLLQIVFLLHLQGLVQIEAQAVVKFLESPPAVTSNSSAVFSFTFDNNGSDPCGAGESCGVQCKLDSGNSQNCSGRTLNYVNLLDGSHSFNVTVNTSSGLQFSSVYTWSVDTVPPTAKVTTAELFTNAVNITVFINFTESCSGHGGFQCPNISSCDLLVYGSGTVLPSTLEVLKNPGLVYSLQVGLSTLTPAGRVTIVTRKQFCTDTAGNLYQRNSNSSVVVHYDRTQPTANVWTAFGNSQVVIREQARTVQATKSMSSLRINVDFSQPITATAAELQSLLNITNGILTPTQRRSRGNRRFGFLLSLNNTGVAVVTVSLPGNTTLNRYGTPVAQTSSVTFLFDVESPQVQFSTTARAHTKDVLIPIVIQFTEPVFLFNTSSVTLAGGNLRSFKEITKTTYALVVSTIDNNMLKVSVAENQTRDVAGNPNVASSVLQLKHYATPAASVVLYSIITAGLLGTTLASGALAVSAANLAAVGAIPHRSAGIVGSDASRNLLGMASHMQILALSSFFTLTLPVEYAETVKGLRWIIPHVNTPWQKHEATNLTNFGTSVQPDLAVNIRRRRRHLLLVDQLVPACQREIQDESVYFSPTIMTHHQHRESMAAERNEYDVRFLSGCSSHALLKELILSKSVNNDEDDGNWLPGRRRHLGANATEFGPSLTATEYESYFLNQAANLKHLKDELNASTYTGWDDFERNMFWLAVGGGGVILLHILTLLFLRWRIKSKLHGALSLPRVELFLLLLSLPALCQASAFIIRGGTKAGIAVGSLLLVVVAIVFIAIAIFIILAVLIRKDFQYKELRPHLSSDGAFPLSPIQKVLSLLAGDGYEGKWIIRKEGFNPALIPRYGILFEDRKGPPRLVTMIDDTHSHRQRGIGRNGLRRISTMNSDEEEGDEAPVASSHALLGCSQSLYILVELARLIALGVIFGTYTDESWSQVSLVFTFTALQFLYLLIAKPFQRRGVQIAETVSVLCELGIFAAAMAVLSRGSPQEDHFGVGVFMLILLVLSFVIQAGNEWFALVQQLVHISGSTEDTAPGVKFLLIRFAVGLMLPLIPHHRWPDGGEGTARRIGQQQVGVMAEVNGNAEGNYVDSEGRRSSARISPRRVSVQEAKSTSFRVVSPKDNKITNVAKVAVAGRISADYWPGEDLQQWRRQNSLERKRLEEAAAAMAGNVNAILPAAATEESSNKNVYDSASPSSFGKSRQWRSSLSRNNSSRVHSADSLSDAGDFTPDRSEEHVTTHASEIRPVSFS